MRSLVCGLATALVVALAGCGEEPAPEGSGAETERPTAGGDAPKKPKKPAPSPADKKRYDCPGEVELSPVIFASKISTIGVPCDEALKAIADTSEAGFTCFESGFDITCRKGGTLTLEYVQR